MKSLSEKVRNIVESQTLALSARASRMKREGIDVCSLTAGEPDFATPTYIKDAAVRALEKNHTHYTNNAGIPDLLAAIAAKFKRDNGITFDPSQILVSCGAKHSIYNALQAICNPGDEVIIPAPYWVSYPEMATLVDAVPVILETTPESGFLIDPKKLRSAITAKTKILLFNSPCNPTGSVHSPDRIRGIAEVVRETGIYVIADEIYEKIIYDGMQHLSIGSIDAIRDQVITVNGMSKAYAMTGWRIGYLGAHKSITDAAAKVQSQVTSNATSISQYASLEALSRDTGEVATMAAEFGTRRDFMVAALRAIPGVDLIEPKGAFYLFPSFRSFIGKRFKDTVMNTDMDLCNYLLNDVRLATVPGSAFGAPWCLRLSYACTMKELEIGAERLRDGLARLV